MAIDNLNLLSPRPNPPDQDTVVLSTTLVGATNPPVPVTVTVHNGAGTSRYRKTGSPHTVTLYVKPEDFEILEQSIPSAVPHRIQYCLTDTPDVFAIIRYILDGTEVRPYTPKMAGGFQGTISVQINGG